MTVNGEGARHDRRLRPRVGDEVDAMGRACDVTGDEGWGVT
jgi:hypothetical protein